MATLPSIGVIGVGTIASATIRGAFCGAADVGNAVIHSDVLVVLVYISHIYSYLVIFSHVSDTLGTLMGLDKLC